MGEILRIAILICLVAQRKRPIPSYLPSALYFLVRSMHDATFFRAISMKSVRIFAASGLSAEIPGAGRSYERL